MPEHGRQSRKRRLMRAIRAHVKAQVDLSWKGGRHPSDWDSIELKAKRARTLLLGVIEEILL